MKNYMLLLLLFVANHFVVFSQTAGQQYPEPEFTNEIYFFDKDSQQVSRLEKGYSKVQARTKLGGMGGSENAYLLEGSKSAARLKAGQMSFIFFLEGDNRDAGNSDSTLQANGMDLSLMDNPMDMMNDPSKSTSLYNMSADKGNRKIVLQSYHGMKILGKSKKESTKYTFSIKKVRTGYYELVIDKALPKGEYAFLVMDMGAGMDGNSKLFAFGVD